MDIPDFLLTQTLFQHYAKCTYIYFLYAYIGI